jgi:uncharacterized membrane protein
MKKTMKKGSLVLLSALLFMLTLGVSPVYAAGELDLYTKMSSVAVTPGDSVSYTIEVINNTSQIQTNRISVSGLPDNWKHTLQSGTYTVERISVKPEASENLTLKVEVPYLVEKGVYSFSVDLDGINKLPLQITVTEEGVASAELTVQQPNLQGHADSSFTFSATLENQSPDTQNYSLRAVTEPGWRVEFKVSGNSVAAVQVESGKSERVTVDVKPPQGVEAGTYKIPIRAITNETTVAETELEVVVTGTYNVQVSTSDERLSTKLTAGGQRTINLVVKNTGTVDLRNINLSSTKPTNWDVTFEPAVIESLGPGETANVQAVIKADKGSIAGDYVAGITARTSETSHNITLRITVETSMLWGWIGILIILVVIGGVYYLIRKYGRR